MCSPDHVSLLVHKTFNASIPRHHIPIDEWEFEYGSAKDESQLDDGGESGLQKDEVESSGQWIHKVTGDKLGGNKGYLEFTVIGYGFDPPTLALEFALNYELD